MSLIRNLQKSRIVALPLTQTSVRIAWSAKTNGSRYTYYQFQIASSSAEAKKKKAATIKPPSPNNRNEETPPATGLYAVAKQVEEAGGIGQWAQAKAAETWAGFGKAEGGWKLKLYQTGERIIDRLDFEELALKSFDPSMGPSISQLKGSPKLEKDSAPAKIPLLFPPSILTPAEALIDLRAYAAHRIPRHRNGIVIWVLAMPFTIPFMIIPIIPNIPFFFCVWRAWSHYTAFRSSQYLKSLADHDILVPEPSKMLDRIYARKQLAGPSTAAAPKPKPAPSTASSSSSSSTQSTSAATSSQSSSQSSSTQSSSTQSSTSTAQTESSTDTNNILLLTKADVPVILTTLELKRDSTAAVDISRAIEQARVRVSKGH